MAARGDDFWTELWRLRQEASIARNSLLGRKEKGKNLKPSYTFVGGDTPKGGFGGKRHPRRLGLGRGGFWLLPNFSQGGGKVPPFCAF